MSSDQPVAPHSLPSHPAPTDAAATSSGVQADATKQPTGSTTTTAAAKHAMEHADSWKPSLDRRQSWNKEDQKRALQMTGIQDGGGKKAQSGAGFTESG